MTPYLLLTVLAIAANAASETTTKTTLDVTTKRPGIQPLPAKLPGGVPPPSYVRDTRQVSVTTTPKSRAVTDSSKTVPTTTLNDITATPTFPRRRRDEDQTEDEDEKTFAIGNGNQRPLFGGAFGQLFANRPNLGLPNLFGNRRPSSADQDFSVLTIQSQPVPAVGLQTFGATQTVGLSGDPDKLTASQTTSQLASQSATLTGSQSTDQLTSSSTTVTSNLLSDSTSTTTHSNIGQTTQSTTESSRKTRDVTTESSFLKPKGDANEDGFKPSTAGTTISTGFKPFSLIGNLGATQKPLGIFSQTSIKGNDGSTSAFASASSPLSEGTAQPTTAQNKDVVGDGWYSKPTSTAVPFKRDPYQQRERRAADQSTQKPQTGSVLSGSTKPLPTTTTKPQYTRPLQSATKSAQKTGFPTTTPKSRATYTTSSPVRPTRSAVTDSPQKTTKNIPTTAAPAKRDAIKTTPKPTSAPKRTARDAKSTTTQKPQTSGKKSGSN